MNTRVWTGRDRWASIALLVAASAGTVWSSSDLVGEGAVSGRTVYPGLWVAALVVGSSLLVHGLSWLGMSAEGPRFSRKQAAIVLVAGLVGLAVVRALVPEAYDLRADRDEALEIASRQLFAGESPWAVPTQVGPEHYPSPLMGGVLLAAPFVAVFGDSSLQIVAWLVVGLLLLARSAGYAAASVAGVLLVSSPAFLNEWVFQSDITVNAIVIAISIGWALSAITMKSRPTIHLVGASILFSLGITDRFFFAAILPLLVVVLWRVSIRQALIWTSTTVVATGLLLLVPWVAFPGSEDQVIRNLTKSGSEVVPNAGVILVAAMLVASVAALFLIRTIAGVFGAASVVLALLPAWMVVLASLDSGSANISTYLGRTYTPAFLVLGLTALVVARSPIGEPIKHSERESGAGRRMNLQHAETVD